MRNHLAARCLVNRHRFRRAQATAFQSCPALLFSVFFLFCLMVAPCKGQTSLSTNNVLFTVNSFGLPVTSVNSITVQAQNWLVAGNAFYPKDPIIRSVAAYPTLTNGSIILSNLVCGVPYQVTLATSWANYTTNFLIPTTPAPSTNANGTVSAALYVGVYYPGSIPGFAYSALTGFNFATNYVTYNTTNTVNNTNTVNVTNGYTTVFTNNTSAAGVVAGLGIGTNLTAYLPGTTATNSFDPTNSAAAVRTALLLTNTATLTTATNLTTVERTALNATNTILAAQITAERTAMIATNLASLVTATNSFDPTNSAATVRTALLLTNTATLTTATNLSAVERTALNATNTILAAQITAERAAMIATNVASLVTATNSFDPTNSAAAVRTALLLTNTATLTTATNLSAVERAALNATNAILSAQIVAGYSGNVATNSFDPTNSAATVKTALVLTNSTTLTTVTNLVNAERTAMIATNIINLGITTNLVNAERTALVASNYATLANVASTNTATLTIATNLSAVERTALNATNTILAAQITAERTALNATNTILAAQITAERTALNATNTNIHNDIGLTNAALIAAISATNTANLVTSTNSFDPTNSAAVVRTALLLTNTATLTTATNLTTAERTALIATNNATLITATNLAAAERSALVASNYVTNLRATNIADAEIQTFATTGTVATARGLVSGAALTNTIIRALGGPSTKAISVVDITGTEQFAAADDGVHFPNLFNSDSELVGVSDGILVKSGISVVAGIITSLGTAAYAPTNQFVATNDARVIFALTNLAALTALSNQIAYVQSQVGCDTNYLLTTSAGVTSVNGTNVWSGYAWTNLNGNSWWSNNAWYASGIAAYGGAFPTTGTTNINGFNPQPVARFFPKTNVAGANITITRSYGVDTIASTGGSGGSATNVSTTNLVGFVGGVLTQGLTNLLFSAAGTNAILSIIPAAGGVTNATLQQYTTNTVINVNAYVTNTVADQIGLAAAKSLAATNALGGLAAFASTNRFLQSGPLGNLDGSLLSKVPGTTLSSGGDIGLANTLNANGTTNYALSLASNISLTIGAQILTTNLSADWTNRVRSVAIASNAIANLNGIGTNTTLVNAQTINVTNLTVNGDTWLNNSNLHIVNLPSVPFILVSGGGLTSANGYYFTNGATNGGQPVFVLNTTNFIRYGFGNGSTNWLLSQQNPSLNSHYYSTNTPSAAPYNGFVAPTVSQSPPLFGPLPAPTFTFYLTPVNLNVIDSISNSVQILATNGIAINTNTANGYTVFINGTLAATNAYFPTATIADFNSSTLSGSDISSYGNMDAQTYTANGSPISFLTNNITSLIASGGIGQAAALNGIYYPSGGGNWTNATSTNSVIQKSGTIWVMSSNSAAFLYKFGNSVIGYYRTNAVAGTNGGMTVAINTFTTGTFPISNLSTNGGNVNQVPTVSASGQVVWTNMGGSGGISLSDTRTNTLAYLNAWNVNQNNGVAFPEAFAWVPTNATVGVSYDSIGSCYLWNNPKAAANGVKYQFHFPGGIGEIGSATNMDVNNLYVDIWTSGNPANQGYSHVGDGLVNAVNANVFGSGSGFNCAVVMTNGYGTPYIADRVSCAFQYCGVYPSAGEAEWTGSGMIILNGGTVPYFHIGHSGGLHFTGGPAVGGNVPMIGFDLNNNIIKFGRGNYAGSVSNTLLPYILRLDEGGANVAFSGNGSSDFTTTNFSSWQMQVASGGYAIIGNQGISSTLYLDNPTVNIGSPAQGKANNGYSSWSGMKIGTFGDGKSGDNRIRWQAGLALGYTNGLNYLTAADADWIVGNNVSTTNYAATVVMATNLQVNGFATVKNIVISGNTNVAPANAVTPVIWMTVTNAGQSYRIPLYQ